MSEAIDVYEELEALRERVAELEDTVEELQDDGESTSSAGFGDRRDQAVLDVLQPGDRVGVRDLRRLYRSKTDITNKSTLTDRVRDLTTHGPFDGNPSRGWQYTGGDDSE